MTALIETKPPHPSGRAGMSDEDWLVRRHGGTTVNSAPTKDEIEAISGGGHAERGHRGLGVSERGDSLEGKLAALSERDSPPA